jgi:hypothetical protein
MRKIIGGFAFAVIITPAWGDAIETVTGSSAVEFVLSTCLSAMDDTANVERTAKENNWFHLPTTAYDSQYTTPHLGWRAKGYAVRLWSFKPRNLPSCFIGIRPFKKVNRDEFFEALSASVKAAAGFPRLVIEGKN